MNSSQDCLQWKTPRASRQSNEQRGHLGEMASRKEARCIHALDISKCKRKLFNDDQGQKKMTIPVKCLRF